MPGGLEGRILREQARGARLNNAMQAMELGRPTGVLQDLGILAAIQAQQEQSQQRSLMGVPDTLAVMGQFVDPTELAMSYLNQLGIEGNPQPLQGFGGMMESQEDLQFRQQIQDWLEKNQAQQGN